MLVRARQFAVPICIALTIFVALLIVHSSESFHDCIERSQYKAGQETFPKKVSPVPVTFFMVKGCWGDYAERNANAIIALFTIILAGSTIGLWIQTGKAARIAESAIELSESGSLTVDNFRIENWESPNVTIRFDVFNGGKNTTAMDEAVCRAPIAPDLPSSVFVWLTPGVGIRMWAWNFAAPRIASGVDLLNWKHRESNLDERRP